MSSDEFVRKPLSVNGLSSRPPDQRLVLRFPRLSDAYARMISRLPPTSRLRQAVIWRAVRLGMEAFNRRDLDAAVTPGSRLRVLPAARVHRAGVRSVLSRPGGASQSVSIWSEVYGADLRVEPMELIDMGDRIVMLAELRVRAQASGVPLTEKIAMVSMLKYGKGIRVQVYFDHTEALEAVGLRE